MKLIFSSPMVHSANQKDLDGSSFRGDFDTPRKKEDEILRRVVEGEKPFGSLIGPPKDMKPLHKLAKKQKHLIVSKLEAGYILDHICFTISVKGKLSDHFDMEALAQMYERNKLPYVAESIRENKDKRFSVYHGKGNWDFQKEFPKVEPWETGLILGYPVRNTMRRIYGLQRVR